MKIIHFIAIISLTVLTFYSGYLFRETNFYFKHLQKNMSLALSSSTAVKPNTNTGTPSNVEVNNEIIEEKDIDAWRRKIMKIFSERKQYIIKYCSKHNRSLELKIPSVSVYAPEYKFFLCVPPKAGCTTLKTHIYRMRGYTDNVGSGVHLNPVANIIKAHMGKEQFKKIMDSSEAIRVLNVRHPISRLVSCYVNKLHDGRPKPHYTGIVNGVAKIEGKKRKDYDHSGVSFLEFLRYVLYAKKLDAHAIPQSSLCNPCSLPYDYIIKTETLNDDLYFLKDKFNIKEMNVTLHQNIRERNFTKEDDYFVDIPQDIIKELYDLFEEEFLIYNYEIPNFMKAVLN